MELKMNLKIQFKLKFENEMCLPHRGSFVKDGK